MTDPLKRWMPMAENIAVGFSRRVPRQVQLEQLKQAARVGLWDALRLHPELADCEKYLKTRIRGSILDELRTMDWLPRRARLSSGHYAASSVVVSSEVVGDYHDRPWEPVATTESPEAGAERWWASKQVGEAVKALRGTADLEMVHQHYFLGIPQWEIAHRRGVTQSNISQRLKSISARMRERLERKNAAKKHVAELRASAPKSGPSIRRAVCGCGGPCGGPEERPEASPAAEAPAATRVEPAAAAPPGDVQRVGGGSRGPAVTRAQRIKPSLRALPPPAPQPTAAKPPRQEIARLRGEGLSFRQIATRLDINVHLVELVLRQMQPVAKCPPKE